MATLVSLDTQAFWSPPTVACLEKPHMSKSSPPLPPQQSRKVVASDPVWISSDEDSDVEDRRHDGAINEALSDDSLPSITTIWPSMAGTQHTQTKNTDSPPNVPEAAERTGSVSSRGSSAASQPMRLNTPPPLSSLSGRHALLATGTQITPLMTASPLTDASRYHRDTNISCETRRVSAIDPVSQRPSSPEVALRNLEKSTDREVKNLDTHDASSHNSGSLDSAEIHHSFHMQPTAGPGGMVASQRIAKADDQQYSQPVAGLTYDAHGFTSATANSTPDADARHAIDRLTHQASINTVRRGNSLPHIRKKQRAKPPLFEKVQSVGAETDSSDDELSSVRKRRKNADSARTSCGAKSNFTHGRSTRFGPNTLKSNRCSDRPTISNIEKAEDTVLACYQEWPLSDATLKSVRNNGKTTLQLEFSWGISCTAHTTQEASTNNHHFTSSKAQGPETYTERRSSRELMKGSLEGSGSDQADEAGIYTVERMLARWKNGFYFLRWSDGTTGWEPKRNVLDKQMLHDFEAGYQGFDEGVDILDSRMKASKRQYLLHWQGRPSAEDSWVAESLMSPDGINRFRGCGLE